MLSPILFEVNTRAWLRDLSDEAGHRITLADVPDREIERWHGLGFTHIWLMGVWQIGPKARDVALTFWREYWVHEFPSTAAEVHGSPYAIQEYAVDSRIGDPLSLLMFKERLNRAGLRLIIDFVPNHLGLDSTEPARFPARFVHSDKPLPGTFEAQARFGKRYFAHGRDPHFPPWIDTVQLDYRVQETHQTMTALAQTAAAYADGLRCDMAMLLLPDIFNDTWKDFPCFGAHQTAASFWRKTIASVRQLHAQVELIAEVYWDREEQLQESGFDYTYNKRFYDYLVRGENSELRAFLQRRPGEFLRKSVHFLENHDEPRIASLLPFQRHKAAAALLLFLPGTALLHDGQVEGRKKFARIQIAHRPDEPTDAAIQGFYEDLLLALKQTHVRQGIPSILHTEGALVGVQWEGPGKEVDFALVNLGTEKEFVGGPGLPRECGSIVYWTGQAKAFPAEAGWIVPGESACILRSKAENV